MDFNITINGLNKQQQWKNKQHQQDKDKVEKKDLTIETKNTEDSSINNLNNFKKHLIDRQENITKAQDKINFLEKANEQLNDISGKLSHIRENTLDKINSLESYQLKESIKDKLENIVKLSNLENDFETISDKDDKNYQEIIEEFKGITQNTIELAKKHQFVETLNNNTQVNTFIKDLNETINQISSAKYNLNQVKDNVLSSIKGLSITLENMNSSHSKIRNIELASKTIDIAREQIIGKAFKSISVQLQQPNSSVNELIN